MRQSTLFQEQGMRTPLESGQNCSKSNFHKMIYIGCCNDFGAGPGSPLGQGDFFSRCIFLDQVTAMKLYLSFSFSLFFPCLFILVPFSLSPFLFITFSFFPLSRCMPLSAYLTLFILFFLREPKATRRSLEELSMLSFCK